MSFDVSEVILNSMKYNYIFKYKPNTFRSIMILRAVKASKKIELHLDYMIYFSIDWTFYQWLIGALFIHQIKKHVTQQSTMLHNLKMAVFKSSIYNMLCIWFSFYKITIEHYL